MPSLPIEMPSEDDDGVELHGRAAGGAHALLDLSARPRRWMLHGVTSLQVFATAMSGFSRSASVRPVAFSIARAGARLMPFLIGSLRM